MTLHQGPPDDWNENAPLESPSHENDGWPRTGCTCGNCVEIRTRPVSVPPDFIDYHATGIRAVEQYIRAATSDPDEDLLQTKHMFEPEQYVRLLNKRSSILDRAIETEFKDAPIQ